MTSESSLPFTYNLTEKATKSGSQTIYCNIGFDAPHRQLGTILRADASITCTNNPSGKGGYMNMKIMKASLSLEYYDGSTWKMATVRTNTNSGKSIFDIYADRTCFKHSPGASWRTKLTYDLIFPDGYTSASGKQEVKFTVHSSAVNPGCKAP